MRFERTLATLIAGIGIATVPARGEVIFQDTFEDSALPQWNTNGIFQTNFQGESVLCLSGQEASEGFSNVFRLSGDPFIFEWDSYSVETRQNPGMVPRYLVRLGDSPNQDRWFDYFFWHDTSEHFIVLSSPGYDEDLTGQSNMLNKWVHNRISYLPVDGRETNVRIEVGEGRGYGGQPIISQNFYYNMTIPSNIDWNFVVAGIGEIGVSETYLDNLIVTEIPEPSSIGLLGTGALALAAPRRRNHNAD